MPDPLDLTDLNPEFHTRINKFVAAAQAAGIPTHFTSGFRDNALQAKLYANYQAKQAGQPLPYPEEGSGGIAAPAGGSYHNFGFATDVVAENGRQNDLIAFANAHPEFGITALGSRDPVHFQITAPSLAAARAQYGDGGGSTVASGPDNRQIFFDALRSAGLSPQQALGALWSIGGESHPNVDTTSYNPNDPGGSVGALQWLGPRRWQLEEIAQHRGVAVTDPHLQAEYMVGELTGNLQGAQFQPGVLEALKNAKTPEEAAHIWTAQMERPKVDNSEQRIANGAAVGSLDANGNFVPGTAKAAPAVASAGGGAGTRTVSAPAPPSPQAVLGSTIGQALAGMGANLGSPSGGGGYMDASGDQPAIRSMAAQTDFAQPSNPLPAQYAGGSGGIGSQLGMLAAQPAMNPLENPANAPSITQGAPGMTAMLGTLGTNAAPGMWDQRGGNQLSPNPYRPTMRLA
jgi:hypothetical protein